jgi:2-iminobutanoate/2-iminopropanoate deaminase
MASRTLIVVLSAVFLTGCEPAVQNTFENSAHDHPVSAVFPAESFQDLPFSDAVRVGHMLYLSGAIGNVPGTLDIVEGGIAGETQQVLENISSTLEKYGSSMDEVVKCTVMMADMSEWPAMNDIYVTFFPNHKPARSAFGANGLALNARVEIECIATVQ